MRKRMIAVLVDARKPGSTGWAAVRSARRIKVRGLVCGILEIHYDGNGKKIPPLVVLAEGEFDIPEGTERIRVKLLDVREESRVFVDME